MYWFSHSSVAFCIYELLYITFLVAEFFGKTAGDLAYQELGTPWLIFRKLLKLEVINTETWLYTEPETCEMGHTSWWEGGCDCCNCILVSQARVMPEHLLCTLQRDVHTRTEGVTWRCREASRHYTVNASFSVSCSISTTLHYVMRRNLAAMW